MSVDLACGAIQGVDAFKVDLEVDFLRKGLPAFVMVGLAEGAVKEAKERVFAALRASSFYLPSARITINLAPADRPKGGSGYDLPLAVGLLTAAGLLPEEKVQGWFLAGELSLSGEVRPVSGILPLAILAKSEKASGMLVAPENSSEAALSGVPTYAVANLAQAVAFLAGEETLEQVPPPSFNDDDDVVPDDGTQLDFADVKGQEPAKRAVEIAAAGGHNILFIGPPGSGKTMLAQRIPSILPPLSFAEALEVTKIHSVSGLIGKSGLVRQRPFRSPHHTVSNIALVGGGSFPKPGEVSLAHRGVLFLDELPEYGKSALEALRQPLEDGTISISRAARSVTFPARCMLVAAMNPCPCGYATDPTRTCTCSESAIMRYRSRLSGPLLDRIDLHIAVPTVPFEDLRASTQQGTSSAEMRQRVLAARAIQSERYAHVPLSSNAGRICRTNADLSGALLDEYCNLGDAENNFLREAMQSLSFSARAYTRILRISRTIADIDQASDQGDGRISVRHLAEAMNCRIMDREIWYANPH